MANIERPRIFRVSGIQVIALLGSCLLIWVFDQAVALAFALGGLIAIIANLYFAAYAFRYAGARSTALIARSFYRGEAGKFTLTLLGFASVFILLKGVHVPGLFAGYIAMTLVQLWFTAKAVA